MNPAQYFDLAVRSLHTRFPDLRVTATHEHPDLDAEAVFPAQAGLSFEVSINLQGDELYLNAGNFCTSWFSCGEVAVVEDFVAATSGLFDGSYRVLEQRVGPFFARAVLQRPALGSWQSIASTTTPAWLLPFPRQRTVLQNRIAA